MEKQDQVENTEAARPRLGFYIHLAVFVLVNALLVAINLVGSPDHLWFQWPLVGWGLGILLHAGLIRYLPRRPGKQRRLAAELRQQPPEQTPIRRQVISPCICRERCRPSAPVSRARMRTATPSLFNREGVRVFVTLAGPGGIS